jgi:hypothetical protein
MQVFAAFWIALLHGSDGQSIHPAGTKWQGPFLGSSSILPAWSRGKRASAASKFSLLRSPANDRLNKAGR